MSFDCFPLTLHSLSISSSEIRRQTCRKIAQSYLFLSKWIDTFYLQVSNCWKHKSHYSCLSQIREKYLFFRNCYSNWNSSILQNNFCTDLSFKYNTFLKSEHQMRNIFHTCSVVDIWSVYSYLMLTMCGLCFGGSRPKF